MEQAVSAAADALDDATGAGDPSRQRPASFAMAPSPAVHAEREWGHHPINIRASIPLPFGRFYVTLVAGRERRSSERLVAERKKHPLDTASNLIFLFCTGLAGAASIIIVAYLFMAHMLGWSGQLVLPA